MSAPEGITQYMTPSDLMLMKRVLDRLCKENAIPPSGPRANRIAARIVRKYQDGARDEAALVSALRARAVSPASAVSRAAAVMRHGKH